MCIRECIYTVDIAYRMDARVHADAGMRAISGCVHACDDLQRVVVFPALSSPAKK